jgi:hypothetical protein
MAQQISIAYGIAVEKSLLLRGMPTAVVEHRDTQELLRELQRIAPNLVVDSTAVEGSAPAGGSATDSADAI